MNISIYMYTYVYISAHIYITLWLLQKNAKVHDSNNMNTEKNYMVMILFIYQIFTLGSSIASSNSSSYHRQDKREQNSNLTALYTYDTKYYLQNTCSGIATMSDTHVAL
jgi:hypothetical protein